jgi:hypothetical protein
MEGVDTVKFNYYKARMMNGDWKAQTIKNLLSQLKLEKNFDDYLAARCAYECYKVEKLRKGVV